MLPQHYSELGNKRIFSLTQPFVLFQTCTEPVEVFVVVSHNNHFPRELSLLSQIFTYSSGYIFQPVQLDLLPENPDFRTVKEVAIVGVEIALEIQEGDEHERLFRLQLFNKGEICYNLYSQRDSPQQAHGRYKPRPDALLLASYDKGLPILPNLPPLSFFSGIENAPADRL